MLESIKIWAQMFFDDGSVSQGIRIPVETLDDDRIIESVGNKFLMDLRREEGLLLMWGAGVIDVWEFESDSTTSISSSRESETSVSSQEIESQTLQTTQPLSYVDQMEQQESSDT